jgi:hypothetical protein
VFTNNNSKSVLRKEFNLTVIKKTWTQKKIENLQHSIIFICRNLYVDSTIEKDWTCSLNQYSL